MNRRVVLQGLGGLITLPWLSSLVPEKAWAAGPVRWACLYFPHGGINDEWVPLGNGADYTITPHLAGALTPVKSDFSWVTGLQLAFPSNGETGGDHERASSSFLIGRGVARRPEDNVHLSCDQIMAAKSDRRIRQLFLHGNGTDTAGIGGDAGDTRYMWTISTKAQRQLALPPDQMREPRAVFDLLFPAGSGGDNTAAQQRLAQKKSILDGALAQANRLNTKLGTSDRQLLAQYFDGIREVERRISSTSTPSMCGAGTARPGTGLSFPDQNRLMLDLMVLAFSCDQTRIAAFMMDSEFNSTVHAHLGIANAGHHEVSHFAENPGVNAPAFRKIQTFYAERFAYFVSKLKATPDSAGGTLLDNSVVVFGSGVTMRAGGSTSVHSMSNIPVLLAGKAGGALNPGRLVRLTQGTRLSNFIRTTMVAAGYTGADVDTFGDNNGTITGL